MWINCNSGFSTKSSNWHNNYKHWWKFKTIAIALEQVDTITLGFGKNFGTVDWCSTIYTNSPGTVAATSGKGFFLNTTSGSVTLLYHLSPQFWRYRCDKRLCRNF